MYCGTELAAMVPAAVVAAGALATLAVGATAEAAAAGAARPHIWFILSDDHGWNSIGYHNPNLLTPNIDSLVAAGRELQR